MITITLSSVGVATLVRHQLRAHHHRAFIRRLNELFD